MKTILTFKASPGETLDWCVREAIRVAVREAREVVLVHNKNEYLVHLDGLVRLILAEIYKILAGAQVEEDKAAIGGSLQTTANYVSETAKQVTKMKIMNMAPGRRFRMGGHMSCMKLCGLGPTGYVSLVTGSINYASVQPEDEFVMEDR